MIILKKLARYLNGGILFILLCFIISVINEQKAWGESPTLKSLPSQTRKMPPPNTVVIASQELKSGLYGYDLFDVLAVLRTKTGISVKSSSDVGAEDWLLIRGLPRDSSRNILVLMDGLPLNDALSESNEFEHIPPLDLIEEIIVYKPPMPVRFGGYTAAIEIFTKGRPEEYKTEISGDLGEYKSGFSSILTEGLYKNFSYRINLDYIRTIT